MQMIVPGIVSLAIDKVLDKSHSSLSMATVTRKRILGHFQYARRMQTAGGNATNASSVEGTSQRIANRRSNSNAPRRPNDKGTLHWAAPDGGPLWKLCHWRHNRWAIVTVNRQACVEAPAWTSTTSTTLS